MEIHTRRKLYNFGRNVAKTKLICQKKVSSRPPTFLIGLFIWENYRDLNRKIEIAVSRASDLNTWTFFQRKECRVEISKPNQPSWQGSYEKALIVILGSQSFKAESKHLLPQGDLSDINILFNIFHCRATLSLWCSCSFGKLLTCSRCECWSCVNGRVMCSSNFSRLSSWALSLFFKLSVIPVRQSIQKRPEAKVDSELKKQNDKESNFSLA